MHLLAHNILENKISDLYVQFKTILEIKSPLKSQ